MKCVKLDFDASVCVWLDEINQVWRCVKPSKSQVLQKIGGTGRLR
jgi:hypothetical protein